MVSALLEGVCVDIFAASCECCIGANLQFVFIEHIPPCAVGL